MNVLGIAYLTMVIIMPDGSFGFAYEQFESDSVFVNALSDCNKAGEDFIYRDPMRNVAFKCEFVPKQKDL